MDNLREPYLAIVFRNQDMTIFEGARFDREQYNWKCYYCFLKLEDGVKAQEHVKTHILPDRD